MERFEWPAKPPGTIPVPGLRNPDLAQYPPNLADGRKAPEAEGLCYLRLASAAEKTDAAGLMAESVRVRVE